MSQLERFLEDQFGTPDAIIGLANANDIEIPPKDTVRKWFERGAIPGSWVLVLFYLIECDTGTLPSMRPYFKQTATEDDIFS